MADNILKINNLHVRYITDEDIVYAVNGINLHIEKGETLGLVGETGAGKTTTALSVLRLLPERVGEITEGSIEVDGTNVLELDSDSMRRIRGNLVSMIFQDPMTALNPTVTIGSQIAEVIKIHFPELNKDKVDEKVDGMLSTVGLPPSRKHEYPHQFSGGMKQRVIIAMALACNPQLLLADEPTTALDVTIQAQVLKLISDLKHKLNTAMLLITHDLGIVAETCDRVAIMYAGEIVELGRVEELFEGENHHPYTDGLFGSIPNMDKDERRLHPIDGLMPDPTKLCKGCAFADRCPKKFKICETVKPKMVRVGDHMIRCHLFDKSDSVEEELKDEYAAD